MPYPTRWTYFSPSTARNHLGNSLLTVTRAENMALGNGGLEVGSCMISAGLATRLSTLPMHFLRKEVDALGSYETLWWMSQAGMLLYNDGVERVAKWEIAERVSLVPTVWLEVIVIILRTGNLRVDGVWLQPSREPCRVL
jgi:hypothetical protein